MTALNINNTADQKRWEHVREQLSPELITDILNSNQRYEGRADSMSSLDILDKVVGMVSEGVAETDIFPLLEARIKRESNAPQQRNRNEFGKPLTSHQKNGCNRTPIWLVRTRTESIWLGMEKKVRFLSPALKFFNSPIMVNGSRGAWARGLL